MLVLRTFLNQPWLRLAVTSALLLTAACEDGGGDGPKSSADAATTNDTAGGSDTAGNDTAGNDTMADSATGSDAIATTDAIAATDAVATTDAIAASDTETGSDVTASDTETGSDTTGSDVVTPTEPAELVAETPKLRPVSATLPDAFLAVAFAPSGQFVTAGWTTLPGNPTPTDQAVAVAKFHANGELDTSFGTAGYATLNIAVGGGSRELARNVVVQSDGKIVAYGTVEHDVTATGGAAADTDVALARFNANGTLDTTFGNQGVVILDLGTGVVTSPTAVAGADVAYGMVVLPDDKLVIHGAARTGGQKADGSGERTDLDNFVVRLSKDGAIDTSFGTAGKFFFDIEEGNATPKGIALLADGSIVGSGYQTTPSFASVQPVVFKLTPNGALDVSFGVGGVYHQIGLASVTEAYAVAAQGDKLVTAGYGRAATTDTNDWLSLRLSADGELDTSWGKSGIVQLDAGANLGENCRDLVILPDGRPLLIGGGQLVSGNTEGLIAVLGADSGTPDTSWAPGGIRSYELGGKADQFWGVALSPDKKLVVVVGLKGVATADTTESLNSDAVVHLIHLDPQSLVLDPWPAPKAFPASSTLPDSLLAVTYGSNGDIFAAGWTTLPGNPTPVDQAVTVAKFSKAGALDTAFGTNGYAVKNIAVNGGAREVARGVVVQSDGKIVAYATVEHDVTATGGAAADTDVALVRFLPDGTLDTTFGTQGVVQLDLGTGVVTSATAVAGADIGWGMAVQADDKLVLHAGLRTGGQKADNSGERTDLDWCVIRLGKDGALDSGFGSGGKFVLDIEEGNASPRHLTVLSNGSILASGYQNTPSFGMVAPIVYKLTPNGALDVSFGVGGVYHQIGLANVTEAYAVAVQGDKLVTAGYGKAAAADTNDWLSLRLSADGELDTSWGTSGIVQLDAGAKLGENCRDLIVLPDGRPLLVGGGQLVSGNTEGLVAVLDAISGKPDASWAAGGIRSYELGGTTDQFWDVALSPDQMQVAIVGLKGVAAASTSETLNSDGVLYLIELK